MCVADALLRACAVPQVWEAAAASGCFETLRWLQAQRCPGFDSPSICAAAAGAGQVGCSVAAHTAISKRELYCIVLCRKVCIHSVYVSPAFVQCTLLQCSSRLFRSILSPLHEHLMLLSSMYCAGPQNRSVTQAAVMVSLLLLSWWCCCSGHANV
jgi:hypothetical protein